MEKLSLRRNVGQSIHILDQCVSTVAIVTFKGHATIEVESPKQLTIMRSELLGEIEDMPVNKYYSLGPDPIAAIASLGFTRSVGMFGVTAYVHESLPLDMRHHGSQEGWVCVYGGERVALEPESFTELVSYVLGVALAELRMRGVK